jgi:glutathione synthase
MRILFIIDPIEKLKADFDSSLRIMAACKKKGFEVLHCNPADIFYDNDIYAFFNNKNGFRKERLVDFDVIFIRQDPPFDYAYLTCTYLLEMIEDQVLIINKPSSIRNYTEKLSSLYFKEYMPKTIVTRKLEIIENFIKDHKQAVIKPLYNAAGNGVEKINQLDWADKSQKLIDSCQDSIMVQEFLPEIYQGDKRVFIAFGKIVGFYRRVPAEDNFLANYAQGGHSVATELTDVQMNIANELAQFLFSKQIYLAGIDLIGDKLTEINITSPTGLVAINNISNIVSEDIIVDKLLSHLKL